MNVVPVNLDANMGMNSFIFIMDEWIVHSSNVWMEKIYGIYMFFIIELPSKLCMNILFIIKFLWINYFSIILIN
jgi:hypothetical protein